jgi:peptide-methionine (S)-S-oxide reductase
MKRLLSLVVSAGLLSGGAIKLFSQTNTMNTEPKTNLTDTAVFGGGCFWCTEAEYQNVKGVKSVISGFAGGNTLNPSYEDVCTGRTGHAEVIQIEFDPSVVSYERLVDLFWYAHDPTTLNRQGADEGTQYRSIILYNSEAQRLAAEASKQRAQARFKNPIVTQIVPLTKFYAAEGYHQNYFRDNPGQPYCAVVIEPKVEKFQHILDKQ